MRYIGPIVTNFRKKSFNARLFPCLLENYFTVFWQKIVYVLMDFCQKFIFNRNMVDFDMWTKVNLSWHSQDQDQDHDRGLKTKTTVSRPIPRPRPHVSGPRPRPRPQSQDQEQDQYHCSQGQDQDQDHSLKTKNKTKTTALRTKTKIKTEDIGICIRTLCIQSVKWHHTSL